MPVGPECGEPLATTLASLLPLSLHAALAVHVVLAVHASFAVHLVLVSPFPVASGSDMPEIASAPW